MKHLQYYRYPMYPAYEVVRYPNTIEDDSIKLVRFWSRRQAQRLASDINGNPRNEFAIVSKWFLIKPYVVLITNRRTGIDDYPDNANIDN